MPLKSYNASIDYIIRQFETKNTVKVVLRW